MDNFIEETIYEKDFSAGTPYFKFSEIAELDLQPDDKIYFQMDDGYYSENNSWDSFSRLTIDRSRPKTESELAKDREYLEKLKAKSKAERFAQYNKLKLEFDGTEPDITTTSSEEKSPSIPRTRRTNIG